jgi:biopolymer transport protein ExbB/TolQ
MIDALKIFWDELTGFHKLLIVMLALVIVIGSGYLLVGNIAAWGEVRKLEREANNAKQDSKKHLEIAAKIAREKVEAEKKVAELEVKIDAKNKEVHQAAADTANARLEYNRSVREHRTEDLTVEQLCAELDALSIPCR